jgi:hypothetical protein
MSYYDEYRTLKERCREEDRRKKECEPYEEIIRRLRKRDKEKAELEQSPSYRKS